MNTSPISQRRSRGPARYFWLYRLFRNERTDPEPFYRALAEEAAEALERRHGSLDGVRIADLGCGPGYYADALRKRGADVVPVDGSMSELHLTGEPPEGAVLGDAGRLPFSDASLDAVFCSNMLEHTPDPPAIVAEMERVLRPGGWAYLSWTNWYSPAGGHEMAPYHYLGPRLGPRLYERRHGAPFKNRYGERLFATHVGAMLALVRGHRGLEIERAEPRYWPWAGFVTRVPAVREVLTWNCVMHLRARNGIGGGAEAGADPDDARADDRVEEVIESIADLEGWLSDGQARLLWDRARALTPPARIVEIGSYRGRSTIVLGSAAAPGIEVVAIDPHAGNDRGPGQWTGTAEEGQRDHEVFEQNLVRAGVRDRVRHVRRPSQDALEEVAGEVDLLYIDGAHGYGPARADLERWGARVRPGGTMLVHDSFGGLGVTRALMATTFLGTEFRYRGRSRSMAEFRREPVRGLARIRNCARQAVQLLWFARNALVRAAMATGFTPLVRLLGHHEDAYPY